MSTDKPQKKLSTDKPQRTSISLHHFQSSTKTSHGSRANLSEPENAEDVIVRYNEEFTKFKKTQSQDSVSLVGEPEDIARIKQCRRMASRRILAICCLGLWCASLCNLYIWMGLFYLWPTRFLRFSNNAIQGSTKLSVSGRYPMFFCFTCPPFLLGAWGMLGAFCGPQKILKSFFLCAPYIVLTSVGYLVLMVYVMVLLTPTQLGIIMDKEIGQYYEGKLLPGDWNPTTGVDKLQTYLKCCGIHSKDDWLGANKYEPAQKVPQSCCKLPNKDKPVPKRNTAQLQACIRNGGPTWERGCKTVLFTFFEQQAILATAFNIAIIVLTILAIINGVLYFRYNNQLYKEDFQYKWKTYFIEVLPISCCIACCRICFKKKQQFPAKRRTLVGKDDMDINAVQDADLIYKNPVSNNLSHTAV